MDISFTVCLFLCVFVCTVTDISGKDKASGVLCRVGCETLTQSTQLSDWLG